MAGEWIKFEKSTLDKPEIFRVARILGTDRDLIVGKLVRLWGWFDGNSTDGKVHGVVDADVDAVVDMPGLCDALKTVGWYESNEAAEIATLPNFDRHNGETAKKRAEKNARQARWREKGSSVDGSVDGGASTAASTKASTREEKRRVYNPEHFEFAEYMLKKIRERAPKTKTPNLESWAKDIRLLNENDGNPMTEIQEIFDWANADEFWSTNILCPAKLRSQYATLHAKSQKQAGPQSVSLEDLAR